MVWVQWTLVTHGGYLATQRDLVKKLAELNRVIDERARGLQSLLSLKGKLDMLEAQIELRRTMQGQRGDEDEDDEDVIYVEGQESEEEEEVDGETVRKPKRLARNGDLEDISDGESEESDDMPLTNGKLGESEDEDSESSEDDDADDLIDDEAEETDNDEADENEVDHDDQDEEVEDEESDDAGAPPPKMQRTGLSSRRR
jgi:U3 small nucleolar RNA-associated protein 5